jgi:hypothetical protein
MFELGDLFELVKDGAFSSKEEFLSIAKNLSSNELFSILKDGSFNSAQELESVLKKKGGTELPLGDGGLEPTKITKQREGIPVLTKESLAKGFENMPKSKTEEFDNAITNKQLELKKEVDSYQKPLMTAETINKKDFEINKNIEAGFNDFNKVITSIPESIYGLFSFPQNAIAAITGLDIATDADNFKKVTGITNPIYDYYKEEGDRLDKEIAEFNEKNYESSSIYENISKGNYGDAFELLGSGILRSAPTSLAIMAGGSTLKAGELTAAITTAFYNQNLEQLKEDNPDASAIENNIKALGMSAAEGVFSSIGTGQIGAVYRDIIKREGVEAGSKIFRNGLIEAYKGALKKYGVPIGALGEGVEETATQITQNMISGKPAFEGAVDAFILGNGSGVVFTAPITLKKAKESIKNQVNKIEDNKKIVKILDGNKADLINVFDVSKNDKINEKQIEIVSLNKSRELLNKELKNSVNKGLITKEQAAQSLYIFDKTQQITGQLRGIDIDKESKLTVANLLKEREDLSEKISGKDEALVVLEKNRINEINDEIKNVILNSKKEPVAEYIINEKKYTKEDFVNELEGKTQEELNAMEIVVNNDEETANIVTQKIKTDAIQEQSTTEVPVQSETGVSEKVEKGISQPKPEVVTEQVTQKEIDNRPISERQAEAESKIKRKDLFIGVGEFSTKLGNSDKAAVPVSHNENNGIEIVEYAHPDTGSVDVIVTGKTDNDFVGFYRIYENGKPTNKWSSKFENQSRNKEDFKTMISGVQELLPEGHQYTEKTSISTDGLRVWEQQLRKGYQTQTDENGSIITNTVFINGDAIKNELGVDVNRGNFENIRVTEEEFENVKKALIPYLEKLGLNESNIRLKTSKAPKLPGYNQKSLVEIDLPVLKKSVEVTQPQTIIEEQVSSKTQPINQIETQDETGQQPTVQPERTGDRTGRDTSRTITPLEGSPIIQGATGPDANLVAVAEQYAADNGIDLKRQSEYVVVDEERAKRIADAYEQMVNDPQNPKVKEAYEDLIRQTKAQYDALVDAGYEFTFFDDQTDPYDKNPYNAMRDLRNNKKMAVYGTFAGYGTEGITDSEVENNPLLEDTGLRWKDQNGNEQIVTANDLFRAVHDAFGHGLEGTGFRARGEENAWQAHVRLFTGPAIAALTSETRGQNSWLNYGPFGETNRTAKLEDTVFAEQKIGLMPEFTWTEGRAGDVQAEAEVSQGLNEQDLPGYDRMMGEVEGIIEKSKKRRVNEAKIADNVTSYVMGSKVYENATDVQREALVRDIRKRFGLKEKAAPSVARILGKIKDVKKVTMTEKTALKKQIKDLARGAKDVVKKQKEIASEISAELKELSKKGKITLTQTANIISKFNKVNLLNEVSVSNFVDYMTKVFSDAEYDNKINVAKSKLKNAKKNIVTKLGIADGLIIPLQRLFSINPNLIPEQYLDRYLELVDMFSARQQVLTLEEKSVVTKDVQDMLDEINNEQSLSDELADRFEASENKVFKDGVLDYSASVKNMLDKGEIDSNEATLMSKYKNRIVESVDKTKMTDEEIQQEKDVLESLIKKSDINQSGLSTRDEINLAKRLSKLIKGDAVKELSNAEMKNVLKLIDNINNGYIPHYAQLIVEKLNSINNSKSLGSAVNKSKFPTLSYMYSKMKSLFTKKDAVFEMIRRNPLFYIDQVLGNFKTKDVFNSILEMAAEGESKFTSEFKSVKEKLTKAQNDAAKSLSYNPNKVLESSFKMMTYAIQLEYDSNIGNKQVNPASEFIKATIKHINDGKSQFGERDAETLQKILNEYTTDGEIDIDKLYKSFNKAEKNAIKTVREINESLTEKSEYTASIIRGQKLNPLTNYIHLNVLHEHQPNDLASGTSFADNYNNSLRPSTKAKSLIERTGKVSPLNFDIFSSAERGAKFVLMDYHLTEPIRTARKTINRTISDLEKDGDMSKKDRKVINAINNAFEESVSNLVSNTYINTSFVDDVIEDISRQGYRAVLAGTGRFGAELLSNVGFVLLSDPSTFTEGLKNRSIIMSADAPKIMNNVNSKETNRIFPSDMLSGRLVDTSVLNQSIGTKGAASKNDFVNRVQQIWNRTGKKYKNAVELTADVLISTPDKIVMRPIWFGSFANNFEKLTGKKVDFKKIAENDTEYMEQYQDAIDASKNVADERSVITGASSNAFTGLLKGASKPNQSATIKAFNNFNNFMSRFLIYEYITARTGIYAAMGNGSLTRRQGVALLVAVTTRMTVYSLLVKAFGSGLIGLLFDDEDEEEEKSADKMVGQVLASTFTSLLLGRDFGNLTKGFINFGVEKMNEEYLDFLRDGEYDPYKDSIQYSVITPDDKQKDISNFILKMGGSFGPVISTANLAIKKSFEPEKKEEGAIERQEKEISTRIPLEIAGNLGFVPFYKDIRKTVLKDMYKGLVKEKSPTPEEIKEMESKDRKIEIIEDMISKSKNPKQREAAEKLLEKIQIKDSYELEEQELKEMKNELLVDKVKGVTYKTVSDLKRYNKPLWIRNFGPKSEWNRLTKEDKAAEKILREELQKEKDKEYGYTKPIKRKKNKDGTYKKSYSYKKKKD